MPADSTPALIDHFAALEDPRMSGKCRHNLLDMVVIAVSGMLCNADDWVTIAQFGRAREAWFRTFLELPNGIPSHDTFSRVFALIDPEAFAQCFSSWMQTVHQRIGGVVAIDGKTLRASYDQTDGRAPIHMVSAWAAENGVVLGQVKTEEKTNEITAIPELLKVLALEGCLVTTDAMDCRRSIAQGIVEQGGDYLLAVVEAQRTVEGKSTSAFRYYISSAELSAERFTQAARGHWGIENSLHWVLDVAFGEDDSRVRKGHGAENLARLRHLALNVLKADKTMKLGVKNKRLVAGWDDQYLTKLLLSV